MNDLHLQYCSSDVWADIIKRHILPWTLEDVSLGEDVLEVGPGPGRTTELLRDLAPRLTAIEVDSGMAAALATRFAAGNVGVVNGDGTAMPFADGRFSAALSFTMLHHVPSPDLQDALLREVARVLRPGGRFAGVDSFDSEDFRAAHVGDICVPVPPETLVARLESAGFSEARVDRNPHQLRFQARR